MNNPLTKRQPFPKQFQMRSGALIWKATYGMCRRPEQTGRKKNEKKKFDYHIMHLKNLIEFKLKSRKPNSKKCVKK